MDEFIGNDSQFVDVGCRDCKKSWEEDRQEAIKPDYNSCPYCSGENIAVTEQLGAKTGPWCAGCDRVTTVCGGCSMCSSCRCTPTCTVKAYP